jgi:hypothetical protein
MLTLLKGESIQSMRQFFSDNGMESMILRTNLVVANSGLDKLLVKLIDDYDNEPITWIRGMIERSPEHRPSSEELAHWTIGTANASRFCCPSCMDEDEMSSQDESLPHRLRLSSTELERSESQTSTRDITDSLDELSTHTQTSGTVAQSTQNPNDGQSRRLSGAAEEKNKSGNKEKRNKSEEKSRRTYIKEGSEADSESDYRPRSSEMETTRHKIEEDIRKREEAAGAADRRAEAIREAARETERAALNGDLPPNWDAHAEYVGQYMQAARRKDVPDRQSQTRPRIADTVAAPSPYEIRYATPAHQYSDDDYTT